MVIFSFLIKSWVIYKKSLSYIYDEDIVVKN